jgi:hypothetical protein
MTCQSISGSDYLHQVSWSVSSDNGATWSEPAAIPSLGRRTLPDGYEEGVCDVVPQYHPHTDTVLAMGRNVTNVSVDESWVTVRETLPCDGWKGDTLLARIR